MRFTAGVGKILEASDFPEMRKPSFKIKVDFGKEIGVKTSSVGAVGAHSKEELKDMLVCCVVTFPPKRVANFDSEVLTLGFRNNSGTGWILITPSKTNVDIGSKLA